MKLKYKKMILLTTMCTMGIGILTLSLTQDQRKRADSSDEDETTQTFISSEVAEEGKVDDNLSAPLELEEAEATPTVAPTPTPIPIYQIEKNAYPEIEALIEEYYEAKNNRDLDSLKNLLSDSTKAASQEDLEKKTGYIEDYLNIKTYVKKSFKDNTYIVYAYHEIKFTGINTPAPSLAKFYVITDENNELKIFADKMDMDEATREYYDMRNDDEDVKELIDMTVKKSEKAIKKDEDLSNFWKKMEDIAKDSNSPEAEGDTD